MKFFSYVLIVWISGGLLIHDGDSDLDSFKSSLVKYYTLIDKTKEYSFMSKYSILSTPDEKEVIFGHTVKLDQNIYQKVDFTELITNGKIYVQIDSKSKSIKVHQKEQKLDILRSVDLKKITNQYKNIKLTTSFSNNIYEFTEAINALNPYERLVLHFDKTNNFLTKVEANYFMSVPTNSGGSVKPKLVIEHSNFQINVDKKLDYLKVEDIIQFYKDSIQPTKRFKEFTIAN